MRRFLLPKIMEWCLKGQHVSVRTDCVQVILDRLLEYITSNSVTITTVTGDDIMEYHKNKATKVKLNSPEDNVNGVPAVYITGPGVYFNMYGNVWRPLLNDVVEVVNYCYYLEEKMPDALVSICSDEYFLKDIKDHYGENIFFSICFDLMYKTGNDFDLELIKDESLFIEHMHKMLLEGSIHLCTVYLTQEMMDNNVMRPDLVRFYKDGLYVEAGADYWVYVCKDFEDFKDYKTSFAPLLEDPFYEELDLEVL